MQALVIAPQPFFSPRGTPFSVYYRSLVMAEMGISVDLLTYGEGQDVAIPGVRLIRIPRFRFLGDIKVGPSYLKLFLDAFLVCWTVVLLLRRRYDFVHAHEEAVFFCLLLKPLFRFRLLYDMHSSLPQQLTNFSFTRSGLLIGIFKKLEDACLRSADAVITICPDLASYVEGLLTDSRKHLLIENSIFEPVCLARPPGGRLASAQGPPACMQRDADQRYAVYAGTLEPYQGIDMLIDGFRLVLETCPRARLLIIGGQPGQVERYRRLADQLGLSDVVRLTGQVPQQEAQQYAHQADVLVSPRIKGTNTPLKVYEQLASGKPLVATTIYSHTQILDDAVAILVEPTAKGLAQGILEALDPNGRGSRVAANAQALYARKYARPAYESKMRRVLEILRKSSGALV
jgi:glycosyltransferase involved in cell wall biosynthesis